MKRTDALPRVAAVAMALAVAFAGCARTPGEAPVTREGAGAASAPAAEELAKPPATPAASKIVEAPAAEPVEPPPPPPPPPPAPKKVVKPVVAGTGYSVLKDPEEAGKEAAGKARAAFSEAAEGEEAKLVIVFSFAKKFDHAKALEAVCSVFDPSLVCGCSAYNAITQEGNNGMLGVLAMGGGIDVTRTLGNVEGNDYEGCGRQIGEALKDAAEVEVEGKLVVLFGDCHVNKNDKVVKGICSVLGERFPVVGAAANGDVSFDKGKVVGKKKNVGILITGDFEIGCSTLNEGPPDIDPNKLVAAAGQAFKNAVGDDRDRTVLVFAFDCGGRRGKMGKDRPRELGVMQAVVGTEMPIFGFYGSGEMGPKKTGDVPRGVGYHISACAIKTR